MELNLGPVALVDSARTSSARSGRWPSRTGSTFRIELDPALPAADRHRRAAPAAGAAQPALQRVQVHPDQGTVTLHIGPDEERRRVGFSVIDTGVGIPDDKLSLIFEAFQQADGTTSRKFGGTGLGLSISREIARLLGGEMRVQSTPGEGSTFTLVPAAGHRGVDDAERRSRPSPRRCRSPRPRSSQIASLLPFDGADDDRTAIVAGDRVLLVIAHDAELAARRARGGPRARLQGASSRAARRSAWRSPASTAPTRCSSSPATGAARSLLGQLKQHPETRHRPGLRGRPGRRAAGGAARGRRRVPRGRRRRRGRRRTWPQRARATSTPARSAASP